MSPAEIDLRICPKHRARITLDLLFIFSAVTLPWNRNHYCIRQLPAMGLKNLGSKVSPKHLDELLDHVSLAQALSEKGYCSCIRKPTVTPRRTVCVQGAGRPVA